jgi:hypothetical protein
MATLESIGLQNPLRPTVRRRNGQETDPGWKTILANQVAFTGVRGGRKVLYVTLLAETHYRVFQALVYLSLRPQPARRERFIHQRLPKPC